MKKKYPKHRLINGRTALRPKHRPHPGTAQARIILEHMGRDLTKCQVCDSTIKVQVHHLNGNPYDNSIENLAILCKKHHKRKHKIPIDIIDEFDDVHFDA